jgi:hypothetical protein
MIDVWFSRKRLGQQANTEIFGSLAATLAASEPLYNDLKSSDFAAFILLER